MAHRFLTIADRAMSKLDAEQYVNVALRNNGLALSTEYVLENKRVTHAELVQQAMKTGACGILEKRESTYFPLMATTSVAMDLGVTIADVSFGPTSGPCRVTTAIEEELAKDLLQYRREAVACSAEVNFEGTCRAFRSYLSACISLVDSTLNRFSWLQLQLDGKSLSAAERAVLSNRRMPLTRKLEEWPPLLGTRMALDKSASYWAHFDRLRTARNGFIHADPPYYAFRLPEMAESLNLCRQGCGEMAIELRKRFGYQPWPEHLMVLRAPMIEFVPFRNLS